MELTSFSDISYTGCVSDFPCRVREVHNKTPSFMLQWVVEKGPLHDTVNDSFVDGDGLPARLGTLGIKCSSAHQGRYGSTCSSPPESRE